MTTVLHTLQCNGSVRTAGSLFAGTHCDPDVLPTRSNFFTVAADRQLWPENRGNTIFCSLEGDVLTTGFQPTLCLPPKKPFGRAYRKV